MTPWIDVAGWTLVHFLWQGAGIAVIAYVLLVLLHHGGEMTAGEIADRFECSWPTTTRHLKRLVDAGLVRVEPEGRERRYRLERETLARVAGGWLAAFG